MYKFYIANILLPIPPQKLTWKAKGKNKTMNLVNGEEMNFIKPQGLMEYSFEILLPFTNYPFVDSSEELQPPNYYLELFELLKTEKRHFKFLVIRQLPTGEFTFNTEATVTLEDYTVNEGEGFDIKVSLSLKQYVQHQTQVGVIVQAQQEETVTVEFEQVREDEREEPKTYTVKAGDTLWNICKAQLGDGGKYKEIATLNNIPNPNLIYVGQVIKFG